jgi:hypothetical protein
MAMGEADAPSSAEPQDSVARGYDLRLTSSNPSAALGLSGSRAGAAKPPCNANLVEQVLVAVLGGGGSHPRWIKPLGVVDNAQQPIVS